MKKLVFKCHFILEIVAKLEIFTLSQSQREFQQKDQIRDFEMQTFLKVNKCRLEAMITEMKSLVFDGEKFEIDNCQYSKTFFFSFSGYQQSPQEQNRFNPKAVHRWKTFNWHHDEGTKPVAAEKYQFQYQ